jgi:hypothetical protein
MAASFSVKTIRVIVTLGKGAFSEGGNTRVIEGLACDARIEKPGLPSKNSARVGIYGLDYNALAEMTMLSFRPLESHRNVLQIDAGELGKELATVFIGEITSATADFNRAPDVRMDFEADTGSYPQQIAASPVTTRGIAKAEELFAQFAREAGYAYRNEGVTASVNNAWFPGSPIAKMQKLAKDIGCELIIDDAQVITLPANAARSGNAVLLSADTGLIGYPVFNQDGIACRCLFNPNLRHGGLIRVESLSPKTMGTWRVSKLTHNLSAYQPGGGAWDSEIEAEYVE